MKVLVLGGTRFVGLRLVRYLASQEHDITILSQGKTQAQLPPGIKQLYADRRSPEALRKALNGQEFEVIFDITGHDLGNLKPVVELFAGKISHYVFQSTSRVYAESNYLPILENFPRISATTSEKTLAAYEVSKVECEDYLFNQFQKAEFPVTILRCPIIYGPDNWMHEKEFSFFVRLLQGRAILLPDDGTAFLHFIYVDDLARAHLSLIGHEETLGQAFNIVSSEAITIEGYIDIIAEISGVEAEKVYLDSRVLKELERPVFPFPMTHNNFYGIYKAKECFGFWPTYSINEGLRHTYDWWQKNLGIAQTHFQPGRLGHDVDLAYEDRLIERYG